MKNEPERGGKAAALRKRLGDRFDYAPGFIFAAPTGVTPESFSNGPAAKNAEVAIVFARTNHAIDHEALKSNDPDVDKPSRINGAAR